ncbi:PadR family transcriptional regulator [Geomicrobium sp. JCM 19038]|uniref:PadR family transcriptional regulator n=1 Tax=Geomicrobium sp. JCM 19038 TaxID=1460635 RepID=UPI00045F14F9|nr:PadR family transcriptional regulator [Geomicrobium sp. JCM 19038]GAK08083.1 transcriptional regulator, PadR family [Geomicrobium sp. JCM 19038]
MSQTQMLKGIIDGCLLAIINEEECYGYEMATRLSHFGFSSISEGTIYPVLLRLQKEELVTSTRKKSTAGPKRKYYKLTQKGEEELAIFLRNWSEISRNVNAVITRKVGEVKR